jgi:hypothetical protein
LAAVSLAGCGSASDLAQRSAADDSPLPGATSTSSPIDDALPEPSSTTITTTTTSAAVPALDQVRWLAPPSEVEGLRLIAARRDLAADCGPLADCELTVPSSTLEFDTADLTVARSLSLYQTLDTEPWFIGEFPASADERTAGSRTVIVDEQGAPATSYIAAWWSEPDGIAVNLQAVNVSWDDVQSLIASLRPIDGADWPGLEVNEVLARCVGPRTQYAPAEIPDGWNRFVLEAPPVGTCDVSTFLFLSLVIPGTIDEPGTLVTFVSSPASSGIATTGEVIDINGVIGRLEESVQADGTPVSSITMQIGDVSIGAHGNTDPDSLLELMESIRLLDDDEWSQLVAEVDTE